MLPFNIEELSRLLAPHMEKSAWPGLDDPAIKARARARTRETGVWEALAEFFGDQKRDEVPVAVIRRSQWRDYARTGERARAESILRPALQRIENLALALWLEHPAADLDEFQDLLWAWCETTWWKLPAHEYCHVDLMSSRIAHLFAECNWVFRDQLEAEVSQRLSQEIASRALNLVHDPNSYDRWQTNHNNWNLVCNANIIGAALYEITDIRRLAAFLHPLIGHLDYAIAGFTEDGGCVEGPGYWEYGFSHFLDAALMLHHRTGGALDLTQGEKHEKIERIARFPFVAMLKAPVRAPIADAGHGFVSSGTALKINRFWNMPEIFQLVDPTPHGFLALASQRDLALDNGEKPRPHLDRSDALLPDMGLAKLNAANAVLAVTAGRNDVPHNHNDVGSFVYLWDETLVLTDPGAPIYKAQTFSSRRYEMMMCRSLGHSVPLVNGHEQQSGAEFFGTLTRGEERDGAKSLIADLSRAYPDPTLQRLTRHFTLQNDGSLEIHDQFAFETPPHALEEAFITWEEVEIIAPNQARIGDAENAFLLETESKGHFEIRSFSSQEHQGRDPRTLRRISWKPDHLSSNLEFSFKLSHRPTAHPRNPS